MELVVEIYVMLGVRTVSATPFFSLTTPNKFFCFFFSDDIDPLTLQPVLNEDNGFYQLGPNSESSEIFVLSVTISYAVHLAKVTTINIMYLHYARGSL